MRRLAVTLLFVACAHRPSIGVGGDASTAIDAGPAWQPALGAHWTADGSGVAFRVGSAHATRIELWIFDAPTTATPVLHVALTHDSPTTWTATVPAAQLPATIYYGYRVWGPNWTLRPRVDARLDRRLADRCR